MMTLQQRYIQWLMTLGYVEKPTRSAKFVMMFCEMKGTYFFLGKRGSIRFSRSSNVTDSFSVAETYVTKLQQWEQSR
jgi:hypothetical protein